MSYELIALSMFGAMMVMLLTGQRVFAAIGFVASGAALLLYGTGAIEMPYSQVFKLFNWFPMLTLPLFIYMGYVLSEAGIAEDLYRMLHVWFGRLRGGLAVGTILLMVIISAMNGLSVAGMAIGATIALPEMLRRGYDKVMITGVVQGGSSLGILIPPSVVLVLYGMIARQPVGQLWLAAVVDRPFRAAPIPIPAPTPPAQQGEYFQNLAVLAWEDGALVSDAHRLAAGLDLSALAEPGFHTVVFTDASGRHD
ncbi:MAG TPA: TRAP transporter large permease subunit, partial [Aestuariivirga sp.]|nr:TRAP transporter large permease subunit [Aestuariivirga sp.]